MLSTVPVLSARAWNALIDTLARKLNLAVTVIRRGGWEHPFTVTPSYDLAARQWTATVSPGFCLNAQGQDDVTIAAPQSAIRNSQSAVKDVPLTRRPVLPLPSTRIIGSGADPVSYTISEDQDTPVVTYEPVPLFFQALGVQSSSNPQSATLNPQSPPRLLRAADIIINHDRPALTTVTVGNDQLAPGVSTSPKARPGAYLTASKLYQDPAQPDPLQQLKGLWSDNTFDALKLATVYFLSPADVAPDSPLDAAWTPYVKHDVFWNLHYRHNAPQVAPLVEGLHLNTGLAAGLLDQIGNQILANLNDTTQSALNFLSTNRIQGRFWTV